MSLLTTPPDAQVYVVGQEGRHLAGDASEPLTLSLGLTPTTSLEVERQGFKATTVVVPTLQLGDADHWPPSGSIQLQPDYGSSDFWWYSAVHQAPWGLALLLAAGAGAALWRRRQRQQNTVEAQLAALYERASTLDGPVQLSRDFVDVVLGEWRLVESVGAGGMATVYRAVGVNNPGAERAVKIISRDLSQDPEFNLRFKREFMLCAALTHPGVVRVESFGETQGSLYYVMEFLRGTTLRSLLEGHQQLGFEAALAYLKPVADAVSEAHRNGIIHRDLKPDNVMVLAGGKVKVTDFGLARRLQPSMKLTQSGAVLGTPDYMAPEQFFGRADERADQYALGVVLWELLTGTMPFEGESTPLPQVVMEPPRLTERRSDLPPHVTHVVARMMAKEAEDRFPSVAQAVMALEAAATGVLAA